MNEVQIQRSRYILRARFRRAQTSPFELFTSSCKQLLNWIENHPIFSKICGVLKHKYSSINDQLEKIINDTKGNINNYNPGCHKSQVIEEHAALCYLTIRASASIVDKDINKQRFQLMCFSEFITGNDPGKIEDTLDIIKDIALDGLFEYLDEQIDDRNAIFGLLMKYKQLSEWFNRNDLVKIAEEGFAKKKGELALVSDLQKYIMNQGVEFIIEPTSASGEVDLILRDPDGKHLIVDAKYIKDSHSGTDIKRKLAKGFHQVMKYCEDYNEPEGFLVTFNNTNKRISLNIEEIDGIPFMQLGSKIIYHIFINIKQEPSASKLGIGKELTIEKKELKNVAN